MFIRIWTEKDALYPTAKGKLRGASEYCEYFGENFIVLMIPL